jgi:hypothetical protein
MQLTQQAITEPHSSLTGLKASIVRKTTLRRIRVMFKPQDICRQTANQTDRHTDGWTDGRTNSNIPVQPNMLKFSRKVTDIFLRFSPTLDFLDTES